MFGPKLKKNYVSDLDKFFRDFDRKRTSLPASRKAEVEKHKTIFAKRDNPSPESEDIVWKDF